MRFGMREIGIVAVGIGVAGVGLAGWSAMEVEPAQASQPLSIEVERLAAAPEALPGRSLLGAAPGSSGSPADASPASEGVDAMMASAVANDPFRPERTPGPAYRLPWERRSYSPPVQEEERPERPSFRVVGVAVPGGNRGGAALIQREGESPRLFRVGDRVGAYELTQLSAEGAQLMGPAGRLNYTVSEPFPEEERRGRNNDRDDERRARLEEVRAQQQQERARAEIVRAIQRRTGNDAPDDEVSP